MAFEIAVFDEATNFLNNLARKYPVFWQRSLKSLGWMVQKEIKAGIQSGAPGGQAYEKKLPVHKRQILDKIFHNQVQQRYPLFGKLRKAVGYDKSRVAQGQITVGWLSNSAVYFGSKMEKGTFYTITRKMRAAFRYGGLKVNKEEIVIPKRETFRPMKRILEPKAVPYLAEKMAAFINDPSLRGSASSNRRYRVYK